MNTLKITKDHIKDGKYVGPSVEQYDGSIEIAANLGQIVFDRIRVTGSITAGSGTSIKAGMSIKAGGSIEAGWSIKAGEFIKAGWSIKAGGSIEAGWSIEAGGSIEAREGIQAQLSITADLSIKSGLRVFAGLCSWREPMDAELEIRCSKLESGEVAYGTLVETGEPEPKEVTLDHVSVDEGVSVVVVGGRRFVEQDNTQETGDE